MHPNFSPRRRFGLATGLRAVSVAAATLALTGLWALPAAAQNQITLTVSSWVAPSHPLSRAQADWCEMVSKATQDRVKFNILPKAVAPPPGTFDAVRDGLVDISYSVHGYTPGRFVMGKLAEMPFLGDSAVATSVAYQRIYEKHLAKLEEHKGMKVLTVFTHGPGAIFNNKHAVTKLSDLDGIKFRVGGGVVNDLGKALGANMTLKPAPQSYELLSSGVVDGVWFPDESVVSFKLEKLIKYRTAVPGGLYNTSFAFVMNPAAWAKIGKDDQAAIEKLSGEAAARHFGKYWDLDDEKSLATFKSLGVQMTQADAKFVADFKAKTGGIEAEWVKEAESKGLKDPAGVMREFRAEIAKVK